MWVIASHVISFMILISRDWYNISKYANKREIRWKLKCDNDADNIMPNQISDKLVSTEMFSKLFLRK